MEDKFKFLNNKKLLLIVPHFKVFIRDQALFIRPYFKDVVILIPTPYFHRIVFKIPYFKKYFRSLWKIVYSETSQNFTMLFPKFFTLPLDIVRKRNWYLAAKSCINVLLKNKIEFDLIHVHFLQNGFIGVLLKYLFNKPLVITAHGGDVYNLPFKDDWYSSLIKFILKNVDQIITVSKFNAVKLRSLGVKNDIINIIPNGYNNKLFYPIPMHLARKKLNLPLNKKILLTIGNLVYIKGHTYLIDAMKFIVKKRNDTILIIIGTGQLKERLEKKVKKLNLNNKVFLVGRVRHGRIPIWINSCNLFILPSIKEGFSTVIPEAMACGKPVIATNVGGNPEIISSSELGILVPPRNPEKLSWAILEGLNKKWDINIILKHSKKYSWNNLVRKILLVYKKVLY